LDSALLTIGLKTLDDARHLPQHPSPLLFYALGFLFHSPFVVIFDPALTSVSLRLVFRICLLVNIP
jgi:hypothetical protein